MKKVKQIVKQIRKSGSNSGVEFLLTASKCGAGDGTRTRDNLLGRQGLCQLSYSRLNRLYFIPKIPACQSDNA